MKLQFKKVMTAAAIFIAAAFTSSAQNPLLIPPALTGTSYNLNVQMGSVQFLSGAATPTYGVNGNILAPTLIVNKGDVVTMNVTNNINSTTTMHWHGLHVPAMDDGGPHQIIQIGNTWSPQFEIMNDAGTYWYHPHGENKTDLQVSKGIAGMIIVKDSLENTLTLPRTYGVDDFPLIVQTKAFDVLNQIAIATELDTFLVVNATHDAYLDAPAQVVRFRILNGSSERSYNFGFSNNMNFYVIGSADGLLDSTVMLNRLRVANGERYEILVTLDTLQGQSIQLMNYGSELINGIVGAAQVGNGAMQIPDYNLNPLNGADFSVLQINVVAPTANPVTTIPTALVSHNPWQLSQATVNRNLLFAPAQAGPPYMVTGPFLINGDAFSMDTINIVTYLNTIEAWTIQNGTMIAHPFHIHDCHFYILDINGVAPPLEQKGKKDVVLIPPQQSATIIMKFEDFVDDSMPYMYHCHLLHHEDDGMMGSFVVIDSITGVSEINFSDLKIFPNPTSGQLSISDLQSLGTSISIVDLTGREMKNIFSENNSVNIDVSDLADGIYFLKLTGRNHELEITKFIVQKN